ncbi:MAG: hypothetical protein PVI60_13275, partial [Desulfobacteraceae bacterium]
EMTIKGYVEQIDWEDVDTGILINDGNDDYYVVMDETGKRLLEHIDEDVEATGRGAIKDGVWSLKISRFDTVDYYDGEDDEYFDYDDIDDFRNI